MRKSLFSLLAIVVLVLVSKSCEKNEAPAEDKISSVEISSITSIVMSGDWSIAHYFDSENEETDEYAGYVFSFNANGILGATNSNSSLSGAWSIKSSEEDDKESSDVHFDILFSSPEIFKNLSEDWEIKKYTDTKIELMNTSGENGGTYLLTFEKL